MIEQVKAVNGLELEPLVQGCWPCAEKTLRELPKAAP